MIQHLKEFNEYYPCTRWFIFCQLPRQANGTNMAMDGDLEYKQQIARIKGDLEIGILRLGERSFSVRYLS